MNLATLLAYTAPADYVLEDTASFDEWADLSGNLNVDMNFEVDGTAEDAFLWSAEGSVEDTSRQLASGLLSTHRIDAVYGSLFYHETSGDFTFVPDPVAINALSATSNWLAALDDEAALVFRFAARSATSERSEWGSWRVAYGVEIENAIGGSGDDIIVGNDLDNVLFGGTSRTGFDRLTGGGGADIFVGTLEDAAQELALTDIITDFTKGEDLIGLVNIALADVVWAAVEAGTRVYMADSTLSLFILEGIDTAQMGVDDFTTSFSTASEFA